MKKYSICDLNVLMDAGEITDRQAEKYLTDNQNYVYELNNDNTSNNDETTL